MESYPFFNRSVGTVCLHGFFLILDLSLVDAEKLKVLFVRLGDIGLLFKDIYHVY